MAKDYALIARKRPDGDSLGTFLVALALRGRRNTGRASALSQPISGQQPSTPATPHHVLALSEPWLRSRSTCPILTALLLASCLVASTSVAGDELRRERVTLSAKAHARAKAPSPRVEDWKVGVLSLRVMDPGRLVVEAGDEVIAAGDLNWGEDERLRVDPIKGHPSTRLPRVVSRERGREEVEVDVPEGVAPEPCSPSPMSGPGTTRTRPPWSAPAPPAHGGHPARVAGGRAG
ncbi:hypothetical protein ACN28S_41505 [Cystobacter fuscus]